MQPSCLLLCGASNALTILSSWCIPVICTHWGVRRFIGCCVCTHFFCVYSISPVVSLLQMSVAYVLVEGISGRSSSASSPRIAVMSAVVKSCFSFI